jgi:hypothetical protein
MIEHRVKYVNTMGMNLIALLLLLLNSMVRGNVISEILMLKKHYWQKNCIYYIHNKYLVQEEQSFLIVGVKKY